MASAPTPKGNLYLTSGGISVYSPAGQLLGRITLPGVARNLAFGDKDLRTLYMIGNSLYRVRVPIPALTSRVTHR